MMWAAIGGIIMVALAWAASVLIAYEAGKRDGIARHKSAQSELRAQRRAEARAKAHPVQAEPFPGEWEERLANTGELRVYAETGDLAEIERNNAAFMRVFDLWQWTGRKRGEHAA